jgi:hypothetical protein
MSQLRHVAQAGRSTKRRDLRADGHRMIQPERAMVYEVESGEMQQGWAMPDPKRLAERLKEILDRRRNGA